MSETDTCDRCGNEALHAMVTKANHPDAQEVESPLCSDCLALLGEWFRNGPRAGESE
jgi:hypothetical protein